MAYKRASSVAARHARRAERHIFPMNSLKNIAKRSAGGLLAAVAALFALCVEQPALAADLGGGVLGEVESMRQEDFLQRFRRWADPVEEEEVVQDVGAWPEAWNELEKRWNEKEPGSADAIAMESVEAGPDREEKSEEFWRKTEKSAERAVPGERATAKEISIGLTDLSELDVDEGVEVAVEIDETFELEAEKPGEPDERTVATVEEEDAVAEEPTEEEAPEDLLVESVDVEEDEAELFPEQVEVEDIEEPGGHEEIPLFRMVSRPFRVETTTNEWFFRGPGTWCDEPQLKQAWWVTGAPPAVASAVVKEVRLDGVAAHAVRVDGQDVVWEPGVHLFLQLDITDEILDLQRHKFLLTLYCWPDEDDPTNEVYLGDEEYGPFRVEWDWWVFDETAEPASTPETPGLAETVRRVLSFGLAWPEEGASPLADGAGLWRRYSGHGLPASW